MTTTNKQFGAPGQEGFENTEDLNEMQAAGTEPSEDMEEEDMEEDSDNEEDADLGEGSEEA